MTAPPTVVTPTSAVAALTADLWLTRFRAVLVAVLGAAVGGIASLAFYTSFEAIKTYAHTSGGIDPKHDFAVPLLVDSFIVVATGADLWFTTTGRRRSVWEVWWPKALLACAATVSFVLNVAHADNHDWAARGVAAIPPAALVLGVELLMMVLRRATALRVEQRAAPAADATVDAETAAPRTRPTGGAAEELPGPARRALPPRRTPVPGPTSAERGSRATGGPGGNGKLAGDDADARMRAYWLAERAKGHIPSGADLDRHVGRDPATGTGRKARARYQREEADGRPVVPAPARAPGSDPDGFPGPASPVGAENEPTARPAVPAKPGRASAPLAPVPVPGSRELATANGAATTTTDAGPAGKEDSAA